MKVYSRVVTVRILSIRQDHEVLILGDESLSCLLASFLTLDNLAQWYDRWDLRLREVSDLIIEEYTPTEPVGV